MTSKLLSPKISMASVSEELIFTLNYESSIFDSGLVSGHDKIQSQSVEKVFI